MNTIVSKLLVYVYNGYNKDIYYEMSLFILSHLDSLKEMTASEFGHQCHTSLVTVKKFCQILGCKDFSMMKKYLFSTIEIRKKQIQERYSSYDENQIMSEIEFIAKNKIDREELKKSIEEIVDDIYEADVFSIIGANYPLFISFNFIEDMLVFQKNCLIQNVNYQLENIFDNCKTYGLLITVTGRYFMLNPKQSQIIQNSEAHFGIISQNKSIKDKIKNVNSFIHLPGYKDSESLNLIIINILLLIKNTYYEKYILIK